MIYLILQKIFLIILFFIQSNNSGNPESFKYFNVLIGMMPISLIYISFFNRTHEGHKFSRDDPIHITIFNTFEEFILFNIEGLKIVPAKFNCIFKTLETLQQSTLIQAISFTSVPVRFEQLMIWSKHVIGFFS